MCQVLSNPEARAIYDLELAARTQDLNAIAVADEFDAQDMDAVGGPDGIEYMVNCRCGGTYILSGQTLQSNGEDVILPCTNCSLHILVRFGFSEAR